MWGQADRKVAVVEVEAVRAEVAHMLEMVEQAFVVAVKQAAFVRPVYWR